METKWPLSTLGEHIELSTGEAFKSAEFTTNPSLGTRLARGDNVKEGAFEWGEKSRYWPSLTKDLEKHLLKEDDILLGMDGSKVGKNWVRVRKSDLPCLLVQRVARLRAKQSLDQIYLRYLIGNEYFRNYVEQIKTGSAIPHISGGQIKAYQIPLPPIAEQKRIAGILGALDDKIELNRKMNETLEQMAMALFKSWFVDFDPVQAKAAGRQPAGMDKATADLFPDSFVETEIGDIPRGWTLTLFSEIADIDKGLSYKGEGLADEGGLPMINLGCFTGRGIFNSERIKRYTGEYRERHLIKEGDLVIANTDMTQKRTIIGSPAIIPKLEGESKILFTHHTFVARFKPGYEIWRQYVFFTLLKPEFREIAEGFSTGTTVLALPRDGLSKYRFCLPDESLLEKFSIQISPILSAIEANNRQSRSLGATRDTLLPKLLAIAT